MVREELLLGEKELPEKQLKRVWLALDDDGSGSLKVGEFGAFMSLGVRRITNEQKAAQRRARILSANKNASAAVRVESELEGDGGAQARRAWAREWRRWFRSSGRLPRRSRAANTS